MALAIPSDYAERVARGDRTALQVIADGTDANSTNMALGYAANLVSAYAIELATARLPAGVFALPPAPSAAMRMC